MNRTMHAPLYERLIARLASNPVSFHVPGHKYGRALPNEAYEMFRQVMLLDVTELADTDDLHHPEGVIKEAEQLAAGCFRSEETMFLVGGSTAGNLAMMLATCGNGDLVLVQRNVHKSIMNGLRLTGACPVFLTPELDSLTGTPTIPSLATLEEGLRRYPDAKAVLLSTPNYYGIQANLHPYAERIHAYGIPLLVDEAHGAHYGFHPDLPQSALAAGADVVVQSTHKTLTALTMGAMLHVQGDLIDRRTLREALSIVQSSSPSYPIMASLDIARAMAAAYGAELFEPSLRETARFRKHLTADIDHPIACMPLHSGQGEGMRSDPLRLLLHDRSGRLTGLQLSHALAEHGCHAEMADERYAVLLLGIGTTSDDVDRLIDAVEQVNQQIRLAPFTEPAAVHLKQTANKPFTPDTISEPFRLMKSAPGIDQVETVPLSAALNRIAAEMVIPYPPGIPLLCPGEPIQEATLTRIKQLAWAGARFQGAKDGQMNSLLVMKQ